MIKIAIIQHDLLHILYRLLQILSRSQPIANQSLCYLEVREVHHQFSAYIVKGQGARLLKLSTCKKAFSTSKLSWNNHFNADFEKNLHFEVLMSYGINLTRFVESKQISFSQNIFLDQNFWFNFTTADSLELWPIGLIFIVGNVLRSFRSNKLCLKTTCIAQTAKSVDFGIFSYVSC